jgi:type II secretory pathway pseudopilin PulG
MTLIELVVAMALLLTLLAMSFGVIGAYYRENARQTQESALQQNFRYAVDSLTNDLREATSIARPVPSGNLIMTESIGFILPREGGASTNVTYHAVSAATGAYRMERVVGTDHQAVTEDIPELVKVYFVYSGRKIYVMMVGKTTNYGKDTLVSLVSLVYGRNLGD